MPAEREQLVEGVCVRLLSDWSSVPQGTTGKICIATSNEGLRSAILWDSYLAIPVFHNPKIRHRKLILSGLASYSVVADENLHMLEVITAEQRREALDAFDRLNSPKKKDRLLGVFRQKKKVDQLVLPFGEEAQVVRHGNWFVSSSP